MDPRTSHLTGTTDLRGIPHFTGTPNLTGTTLHGPGSPITYLRPPPPPAAATPASGPEPPGPRTIGLRTLRESVHLDPGVPGARALAVVGVLAALAAGFFLWLSRPEPQPLQGQERQGVRPGRSASPSAGSQLPVPSSAPPTSLVVHVLGKVAHPGVFTLPTGSRVTDAITAAGGLAPGATTGVLNLARRLTDGEQIPVGVPGAPPVAAQPTSPSGLGPDAGAGPAQPLDLNSATADQLQQLPGVGPVYAKRILDYRTQHGGFHSIDELRQISGIGEHRFAQIKPLVHV